VAEVFGNEGVKDRFVDGETDFGRGGVLEENGGVVGIEVGFGVGPLPGRRGFVGEGGNLAF